jgi:hypothetical protein
VSTHASGVRLLSPPVGWNSRWHRLECLNFFRCYWLPEFNPHVWLVWSSKSASTCQRCQMQAHAAHGTARIGFWCPSTIFQSSWWKSDRDRVVGTDWLQSLHHGRNATPVCHDVALFCCVKHAEMTLEFNPYELTTPFECCAVETEQLETQGNCLRFWYRKCIKQVKNGFVVTFWYLLGGKFSYAGPY